MHVKLITYMNNYNIFDLIIDVVFAMIPQLGVLGTKDQYLLVSFWPVEVEIIPKLHLRYLYIRSEIFLFQYETE